MKSLSIYTSLILLIIFSGQLYAQRPGKDYGNLALRRGIHEYNSLRFLPAVKYFSIVLEKDPENITAMELIASCYRNIRDYDNAERWYRELSKRHPLKPIWALNFAEALANKGNYEESEQWYRKYYSLKPDDKRGETFPRANLDAIASENKLWKVENTSLNTGASEYSPMYYKGGLMFVSNRKPGTLVKNVFGWDETPFSNLYITDSLKNIHYSDAEEQNLGYGTGGYDYNDDNTPETSNDSKITGEYAQMMPGMLSGAYSQPETAAYLLRGNVNTKYHEGPAVLLPDGSLMFTRNSYYRGLPHRSSSGIIKLKLYTADRNNLKRIKPFPYNSNQYSVGHPAINKDGNVLVFTSDMPGGFGGTDLYYSVRTDNGNWGRPINLGPKINTEGNEMFPYFDHTEGKLYFSSTGHPGLGGLDLFEVMLKDLKPVYDPKNLGAPFNSKEDDFGMIMSEDGRSGYFSSNRNGSDDIFYYYRQNNKASVLGTVVYEKTGTPVNGGYVFLHHNGETDTLQVSRKGQFYKELDLDMEYQATADHPGFATASALFNTNNLKHDTTINIVLKLDKTSAQQKWVLAHCDSLKQIFTIPNIYYDLDRAAIREDARPVLNRLSALMIAHPEITIITSSHCDSRASNAYNRKLSLARGLSARAYLVKLGIDGKRIQVEYFGKSRLVNYCIEGIPCSEEDQQMNRRTEFDIILHGINLSHIECN